MSLEYCCKCNSPTGRAGRGDDSLYTENDGPFCVDCYPDKQVEITNDDLLEEALDRAAYALFKIKRMVPEAIPAFAMAEYDAAIAALDAAKAQVIEPPECKTEGEGIAFAFGWWKALEANRAAQPVVPQSIFRDLLLEWEGMAYDGQDFLRRVRLALHGPLSAPIVETVPIPNDGSKWGNPKFGCADPALELPVVAWENHKACMPPTLDYAATAGTLRSDALVYLKDAKAAIAAQGEKK